MLIRPIETGDLPELLALAKEAGVGVTTLQANPERLSARILASETSLNAEAPDTADASYVFVLEDELTGKIVGTSAIEAAVGMHETWYNYRVGINVHASRELGIYKQLETLFLNSDMTGSSELCSLFLLPHYRKDGNGSLLSKARFLFMAEHSARFSHRIIAEMRGISDEVGRSPFWESLGRHFFRMDFARADFLSYVGSKSFIAELMPQHPIYTCFLHEEARLAIGEVHEATRPARAMLEAEGFHYQGYVDIFDAGPTLECELDQVRAVRASGCFEAQLVSAEAGVPWLVSNRRLVGFRCVIAIGQKTENGLQLTQSVLERLGIAAGDSVRAVPLSARE
ncbi:arginine N-succinyltransferase [Iodobacter sp. HSC-16F04]|uniref:Arginine N-succinyltransferase n=1 Tax=Iodobacter violaceini TaxID=3044271 RepID=A0ABX0KYK1_9NEIS|nr:arginine N-succinyltransferase [Iodobacter violacea]NHQ87562.1 arginine N-succinyltransferase [Iodobacter violacea]